jgi:hypothetical protein
MTSSREPEPGQTRRRQLIEVIAVFLALGCCVGPCLLPAISVGYHAHQYHRVRELILRLAEHAKQTAEITGQYPASLSEIERQMADPWVSQALREFPVTYTAGGGLEYRLGATRFFYRFADDYFEEDD